MEEFGSLWNYGYDYQENFNELKLKLQYTTIELESAKMEANEQSMKYKEELKLMLNLLNLAYQERDEARDQCQNLLNKLTPHPQPETPLVIATKANSTITESNSLSDTYNNNNNNNHNSHGSSPVDSLFEAVTSPDFLTADSSGIGLMNQQPFVQEFNNGLVSSMPAVTKVDSETALIDDLAKGKTLPEKGKLLQAVMEAGPLLSTLLVAGPLPQWRNPPPSDTSKIPPVSIKGCDSKTVNRKSVANPNNSVVGKRVNSSRYPDLTRGTHQMCSSAMLSFASSGLQLLSSSKRQRFE